MDNKCYGYHNIISVVKVHEVHEIGADNLNLKTKEKMQYIIQ